MAPRPPRRGLRSGTSALRKAIAAALDQNKAGNLEPETIQSVQDAIDKVRLKFEKTVPQDSPDYLSARDTIRAMVGLTRMLYSPKMEQILAELDDYQGTTLGDLLGFMQAFNLRFAPANSFRQRQIYTKLYPMLSEQANGSLGSASNTVLAIGSNAAGTAERVGGEAIKTVDDAGTDAVNGLKSAAVDLFRNMKLW